jgi:hypothetical protein
MHSWALPLVMGVMGDAEVLPIVVQGLSKSSTTVPNHALRVAQSVAYGLGDPDKSQAEWLGELHKRIGVTPAQLAKVWQWSLVFTQDADVLVHGYEPAMAREADLLIAAQQFGRLLGVDSDALVLSLYAQRLQVTTHFSGITELPALGSTAFWQVADHPYVRNMLPAGADDATVLAHCGQFLPQQFVALFKRG